MRVFILLLLVLAPGCFAGRFNERAFRPRADFQILPEDLGLAPETFIVPVQGAALHAWRFRAGGAGETVVVLGGNAANKELFLPMARELVDAGYDTVLVDWRGFGLSTGEPDLWKLIPDACALVEHVRADPRTARVALLGVSLGSPVALGVASRAGDGVAAVVVEGLLVPRHALAQELGGFVAALSAWALIPAGFEVTEKARELPQPILYIHGVEDGLTPLAPAARVMAAPPHDAAAQRAHWIAVEAGHAPGIAGLYGPEYTAQLLRFLDSALLGAPNRAEVRLRWSAANGLASVEPGPDAVGRLPVELLLVREQGRPMVARVFVEPGHTTSVAFPDAREVIGAFANVPAAEVRELPGGGWERANGYLAAQRACWELEDWIFSRLGHGAVLRLDGRRVFLRFESEPMTREQLATACRAARARLEETDESALPLPVRLTRSSMWRALAARAIELGDEVDARDAMQRSLALLPADPFASFRFTDSNWQLGVDVDGISASLEALADLASDPRQRAADLELAGEWRARALARARRLEEWHAAQRAP